MKLYFSILSVCSVFIFSCSSDKPAEEKTTVIVDTVRVITTAVESDTFTIGTIRFELHPSSREQFDSWKMVVNDTSEVVRINKDAPFVSRFGDSLIFVLASGKKAYIVNNDHTDGDDYASYSYLNDMKGINQWLIAGSYYEAWGCLFINKINGDTTFLYGTPIVSPDKKYVLTYNMDLYAGFTYNGFELYEMKAGKPVLVERKEFSGWGPDEVKWMDDTTLLVKQTIHDIDHAGEEQTVYKKMLLIE